MMIERKLVLVSIGVLHSSIHQFGGDKRILLCLVKLLLELLTKPNSWDIIRYERNVDLKELCKCLFKIPGVLAEMEFKGEEHDQITMIKTKCLVNICLLYTSPSPRDGLLSRMPSSA